MKKNSRTIPLLAICIMILSAVLSRTASLLYSVAATNILYSESLLPDVLLWVRQIFAAMSFGCGVSAAAVLLFADRKKAAWCAVGLHATVLLADALTAFLADWLSGAVSSSLLGLAMLMNLGDWLVGSLTVLAAFAFLLIAARHGKSRGRGIAAAAAAYLISRLGLRLFSVMLFLIEVEFTPYASELQQIAGELLQDVFLYGVAWICAFGLHTQYPESKSEG